MQHPGLHGSMLEFNQVDVKRMGFDEKNDRLGKTLRNYDRRTLDVKCLETCTCGGGSSEVVLVVAVVAAVLMIVVVLVVLEALAW